MSLLPGTALTRLGVALAAAAGLAAVVVGCTGARDRTAVVLLLEEEHAVTASAVTTAAMRGGCFTPIRTRE